MKTCIGDIETDGLQDCKHIWVAVFKDLETKDVSIFREGDADICKEYLQQYDRIIGHNFVSFDMYWLNTLWDTGIKLKKVYDTLIVSRLTDSLLNGHSLRDWGNRLQCYKDHNEDWSKWSQEMEDYCIQDVVVGEKIYRHLCNKFNNVSEEALRIEHQSQWLLSLQERAGFLLDVDRCAHLKQEMETKYMDMLAQLETAFPPRQVVDKVFAIKSKKDGALSKKTMELQQDCNCVVDEVAGTITRYKYKEFSIDSPSELVERVSPYWKPYVFNKVSKTAEAAGVKRGSPKVCLENLETVSDDAPEAVKLIVDCKVLKSRSTLYQTFLDATDDSNRMHGTVFSIGTGTHRMSHNNPCTGNIPSKGLYGPVTRELFIAPEGRVIVGCDAAGIQLRALAHYVGDVNLIHQILHSDIHWYLARIYDTANGAIDYTVYDEATMKPYRALSKTLTYAMLMGAGMAKLGLLLGGDSKRGKLMFDSLAENIDGWLAFKKEIERRAKYGYMVGLDGRKIPIKSAHFGMSSYLQSFEAVAMKWAMIEGYKRCKKYDGFQVAVVHDEFQWECAENDAENIGNTLRQCIIDAGEHFNVRCPLDGEYKIGKNWHETH